MIKIDDYHLTKYERNLLSLILSKGLKEVCTKDCNGDCDNCKERRVCDLVDDVLTSLDD